MYAFYAIIKNFNYAELFIFDTMLMLLFFFIQT